MLLNFRNFSSNNTFHNPRSANRNILFHLLRLKYRSLLFWFFPFSIAVFGRDNNKYAQTFTLTIYYYIGRKRRLWCIMGKIYTLFLIYIFLFPIFGQIALAADSAAPNGSPLSPPAQTPADPRTLIETPEETAAREA